jgi:hypothetical protein
LIDRWINSLFVHHRTECRSHSHKREELNSNSSMPSKEKIELLFSKYLVTMILAFPLTRVLRGLSLSLSLCVCVCVWRVVLLLVFVKLSVRVWLNCLHRGNKICRERRRT